MMFKDRKESKAERVRAKVAGIFASLDLNGDGQLAAEELLGR